MKTLVCVLPLLFLVSCASVVAEKERTIKTFIGLKRENVVMQKYDFSCGVSSLLTLFKYHFGDDSLDEKMALANFLERLSEDRKKNVLEKGFSVRDLKLLSEELDYKVYAVTLKTTALLSLDRPILVYLETQDYKHFAVLRGIKNKTVFLADSSAGKIRMSVPAFLKIWKGNIAIFLDAPLRGNSKLKILDEELEKPEIKLLQNVF